MLLHSIIFVHFMLAVSANIVMELDTFQGVGPTNIVERSNASMGKVVHLVYDSIIRYEMCIHSPIDMQIEDLVYSNDADNVGDVISIDVDGIPIGSCTTNRTTKSAWNEFQSCGMIGEPFRLDYGNHMLTLHISSADEFGVELDTIEFNVDDSVNVNDLACDVYCFNDINFRSSSMPNKVDPFQLKQFSRATVCTEEENIKVGIYHAKAKRFDIKATRPQYASCSNNRDPDYRGCKLASPAWAFNDVSLQNSGSVQDDRASLIVDSEASLARVAVTFDMSGFSTTRGEGESRTAGVLFVRLENVQRPIRTTVAYRGQSGRMETADEFTFRRRALENTWILPDDTWGLNDDNSIILTFNDVSPTDDIIVGDIRLEKRPMSTKAFKMYDDGMFVWEGVHRDPSWLSNQQKTNARVKLENEIKYYSDIENLRVYMKKPYGDGYAQIFVLHNDGHSRIQPVTPHGMDWTPFGSSFIIGPNNPNTLRPYATIKMITIEPKNMKLTVKYYDQSSLDLILVASPTETNVNVRRYNTNQDRSKYALLTFLSMWIQDGYSNVDTVALDDVEVQGGVIGRWNGSLNATKVNFYRRCISRMNTQSPDIEVKLRARPNDRE